MSPLVSVIMPAYNSERYITDAIESVVQQTYTNWELIVIDDGSSDDTVRRIEEQAAKDLRIRFYKNEKNIGVSETRNKAISLANGEWIAFLDSDDIWEPLKIEKQMRSASDNNYYFLFTGSAFIAENGERLSWIMPVPHKVSYKMLLKQNVISCSSVLIKKELIYEIGMHNDNTHEDFALWLKTLKKGIEAYGVNEPLLIYRLSNKSKSGNKLKSIAMSYRTYRSIGLSVFASVYYLFFLIINGIQKYLRLYC